MRGVKRVRRWPRRPLFWLIVVTLPLGLALAVGLAWRYYRRGDAHPGALPVPLASVEEPELAEAFDYPLDPERFGPYVPFETGPWNVDTRFGAQNPGLGDEGKCFVNREGERVPFSQLYHAGEDWFALNAEGKTALRHAAGTPVRAVARGVVTWSQSLGSEGAVLIVEHHLPEEERVWSVYWHVADVEVAGGEAVERGERLGVVHDRGLNSHLHWEIRTFADGSDLFPPDSAGGRGSCNVYVMGVGYTWDDVPGRARPEAWGYLDPVAFIEAHRSTD
jgi:murein DD-endopeptidase MepM/ murein hydrolase activator NlpD